MIDALCLPKLWALCLAFLMNAGKPSSKGSGKLLCETTGGTHPASTEITRESTPMR